MVGGQMKYSVNYQYRPKGKLRPVDNGQLVPIEITEATKVVLLPNIGDHVLIGATVACEAVQGRVASRLFSYQEITDHEIFCHVNIVLDECDEGVWEQLSKV
jgi:hypothetical protein